MYYMRLYLITLLLLFFLLQAMAAQQKREEEGGHRFELALYRNSDLFELCSEHSEGVCVWVLVCAFVCVVAGAH